MVRLKYFEEDEFKCAGVNCFDKMNKNTLIMLDEARTIANLPFHINSTWRSMHQNEQVRGKRNSAHLRGTAVDIACANSSNRMVIVEALLAVGFTRIGIAKTFIHVDNDEELIDNVIWLY